MSIGTTLRANLHEFNGAVKQTWGKLTGSEIDQIKGKTEKLVGTLMKRYDMSEKAAQKEVIKFMKKYKTQAQEPIPH